MFNKLLTKCSYGFNSTCIPDQCHNHAIRDQTVDSINRRAVKDMSAGRLKTTAITEHARWTAMAEKLPGQARHGGGILTLNYTV